MKRLRDAVVVGAGPAGCAAAIYLAKSGLGVTLVEASMFPRHRPGETLHPGIEPILQTLGVLDAVKAAGFPRHQGHYVSWRTEGEGGSGFRFEPFGEDANGAWSGYQAWRPEFDRILLAEVRRQGVEVLQPLRVVDPILVGNSLAGVTSDRGEIRAATVLDATGRAQWLTRKLGVRWRSYSPKLLARYGYASCAGRRDLDRRWSSPRLTRDSDGWTWTARVRHEVVAWVRLRTDGVDPGAAWWPEELAGTQRLVFGGGADVTWRMANRLAGPGWFALGDAAAVLDPASSHGVLRALMSGIHAARLVTLRLHGRIDESLAGLAHEDWFRRWFFNDINRLRQLYGWPTAVVGDAEEPAKAGITG